jgi:ferredoxin-NADP reductase
LATPVKFCTEVTKTVYHSDDVATYEFRYLDKHPRYRPGQFLHLALDEYDPSGHWPESRVFTIAKGATDREFIRLTIARKGNFTGRILDELQVGKKVWMKAPYGEFIIHSESDKEVVLIGGGTGVTPFVAFMEDALVEGIHGKVWLHYGARDAKLLVFKYLSDKCAEKLKDFSVRYYAENSCSGDIINGRINIEMVCSLLRDINNTVFYLCGPQEMIDVFSSQLKTDFGLSKENVRVDTWV